MAYSPGLSLTSQTVNTTITDTYNPCVSSSQPSVVSGTSYTDEDIPYSSCLDPSYNVDATGVITWNTSTTSTYEATVVGSTDLGHTILTSTGTITSGLFAGDLIVLVRTYPTLGLLDCLTPGGVTSAIGVIALEITST